MFTESCLSTPGSDQEIPSHDRPMSSMSVCSDYKFTWGSGNSRKKAYENLNRKYSEQYLVIDNCDCETYADEKCTCFNEEKSFTMTSFRQDKLRYRPTVLENPFENGHLEKLVARKTSQHGDKKRSILLDWSQNDGRKSCPDLLTPCVEEQESFKNPDDDIKKPIEGFLSNTLRKKREKSVTLKPIHTWTQDDVMVWIQSIGLQEMNSLLIGLSFCIWMYNNMQIITWFSGYDITGSDIISWNEISLGM